MFRTHAECFLSVGMPADHSVDTALEMGFNSGAGKLETGRLLFTDDLLASHNKPAGDAMFKAARQQPVKQPENRPHALLVCKKLRIIEAQAVAVRDMHPQLSKADIGLLSQAGYAERRQEQQDPQGNRGCRIQNRLWNRLRRDSAVFQEPAAWHGASRGCWPRNQKNLRGYTGPRSRTAHVR